MRPRWFRDEGERFTGLELLFDLVFVFGVSQLTRVVREDPGWPAAITALVLFVPVWWAWTGITFATDRFPADDARSRVLVIAAGVAAAVMALAIPTAPGAGGVAFAGGYAAIRLLVAAFYLRARAAAPDGGRLPRFYAAGFTAVAAIWLASIALPAALRPALWVVAMAVDVALPQVADRRRILLPVDGEHLAERCAAFVIIVIGDVVVETLTAASGQRPSVALVTALAAAAGLAVALWWGFFDHGSWHRRYEGLGSDRSGRLAATIGSYLHFPVVVGIAAAAAGAERSVEHPGGPIGVPTAAVLVAGCACYLLALNGMTLVLRVPRRESLASVRLVLVAALGLLLVVGSGWSSTAVVGLAALVLAVHAAAAGARSRQDRRRSAQHR